MVLNALTLCLLIESVATQFGFNYQPAYVQNHQADYQNIYNMVDRQDYNQYLNRMENCQCSCMNCDNPVPCCIELCLQCRANSDTNFLYVPYPVPIIIEKKSTYESTAAETPQITGKTKPSEESAPRETTTTKRATTTTKRATTTTKSTKKTTTKTPKTAETDDMIFSKSTIGLFLVKRREDPGDPYLQYESDAILRRGRTKQHNVYHKDGIQIRPTISWRHRNMKSNQAKRSGKLDIIPIDKNMIYDIVI